MDAAVTQEEQTVRHRGMSVKLRITGGFAILCLIFAASITVSGWQEFKHRSDLQDLDKHSSTATTLQEIEAQAGIAALLLQRYVVTGDETLAVEVEDHAQAAVAREGELVSGSRNPAFKEIAVSGGMLAQGAGSVVALQESGDKDGAAAAMEDLVPLFRDFRLKLEAETENEIQEVADLRSAADRAGDTAFILLIASGIAGVGVALAATVLISRSILGPLSALEATAAAASRGDLSVRAPATGPRELAQLGAVLNQMMTAVETHNAELSKTYEEIREHNRLLMDARAQAATDPLTGLGNHRAFHKRIQEEVVRANASSQSVSLILFDVDGFKTFNDSLGHPAGDEILRRLSEAVCGVVPHADAYRYGGDEFAVLIAGPDRPRAIEVAEAIRQSVEVIPAEGGRLVTVSLGVASFPEMADTSEELIYRADMAMYWAKSTGKNRVGDWDGLLSRRARDGASRQGPDARTNPRADVIVSLISALNTKDPATRDHTERCTWYAGELAQEMGLPEEQASVLKLACVLHDIGKLAIPDAVLMKPGPLDEGEWREMRQHPVLARHILSHVEAAADAVPVILHHHERFDGAGYPGRLAGEDIPLASRILMVTDAFDAMTSDRPYRQAVPVEEALEELRRNAGTQFDPAVVERFAEMIGRKGIHPLRRAAAAAQSGRH